MAVISNKPHLITFDVYSALLDVELGLTKNLIEFAADDNNLAMSAARVWRTKQLEWAAVSNSLNKTKISFEDCTTLSLSYVANKFKLKLSDSIKKDLVAKWDSLPLYPEADEAVVALKNMGFKIAILSNGDKKMLDAISNLFSVEFDHILSAEDAGKFKPDPSVYALPETLLGIKKEQTLHIAGGANDVVGAVSSQMPCIWSNKSGDLIMDFSYSPALEIRNLSELSAFLSNIKV